MLNTTKFISSIFKHQDTDTLNILASQDLDESLCAKVETRPHDDGVLMTIIILDKEEGKEVNRQRLIIKAVDV